MRKITRISEKESEKGEEHMDVESECILNEGELNVQNIEHGKTV